MQDNMCNIIHSCVLYLSQEMRVNIERCLRNDRLSKIMVPLHFKLLAEVASFDVHNDVRVILCV